MYFLPFFVVATTDVIRIRVYHPALKYLSQSSVVHTGKIFHIPPIENFISDVLAFANQIFRELATISAESFC
jgi:hypothetical protein